MNRDEWSSMLKLFSGTLDGSLKAMYARQACVVLGEPESDKLTDKQIQKLATKAGAELLQWIGGAKLETLPALTLMGVLNGLHEAEGTLAEAQGSPAMSTENIGVWIVSTECSPMPVRDVLM